jgi:Kef-type K+ transport system membrane component KefB
MPDLSFSSLAVVMAVAFFTPLALGLAPRLRVPSVVVEIVLGIVIGPAVLGWAHPDEVVKILSTVGLAFLLFLAGLELDLTRLRGQTLHLTSLGFGLSLAMAAAIGFGLSTAGLVRSPALAAVILTATSLGLVLPVLKEANQTSTALGQLIIAAASIADFAAIVLLSLLFSKDASGPGAKLVLLVQFALLIAVLGVTVALSGRSMRISALLVKLQDSTAEIRVRGAVLLLILVIVLAQRFGLETILGAFVAGAVVGLVDRDAAHSHPRFRLKLDAIGYGFVIPVFFVTSGMEFDLRALLHRPSALALVPLFLVALLVVRGVPAVLYRPAVGRAGASAAGLLQATSLPFIVASTSIGVSLDLVTPATAAAFVAAGLASALIFPVAALAFLRGATEPTPPIR